MYRIAVCEDDPRTAEQNKTAACRELEGKGRIPGLGPVSYTHLTLPTKA